MYILYFSHYYTNIINNLTLNKEIMTDNKYNYGREMIFELRACHAISAEVYLHWLNKIDKEEQLILSGVGISSLVEKAKEEERLNREKMITNYNAPLDKIQPYENKHLLALIDEILKEQLNLK